MSSSTFVDGIEVMWRPGCPFCARLGRALLRRGIATTDIDIWSVPEAAARVREATGGNETVPTVFIGDCALVNPSVDQLVAAVERELPHRVDELIPPRAPAGTWRAMFGFGRRS